MLIERIPADEMGFILDTYWVQRGGGDPAQWLEKLAADGTMAALGEKYGVATTVVTDFSDQKK